MCVCESLCLCLCVSQYVINGGLRSVYHDIVIICMVVGVWVYYTCNDSYSTEAI